MSKTISGKQKHKIIRFSDYFNLGKSQAELDFVDIPLNTDIPLFVDPYALSVEDDPWFIECNNLVVGYFQLVIDSIRSGDIVVARQLLFNLHEPNDTHLGFSSQHPAGRGIGRYQADDLYETLKKSKAIQTGHLRDLNDCELLIPGISNDKISDITINIIRGKLVEYTESQCKSLNIPTSQVASGTYWNAERRRWANHYAKLPVYDDKRIVLVPKASIRFHLAADHQEYYRHFVLQYLQAEHLNAGSALVTVLKSGKRKVYKNKLEKKYPLSKEFLFEFSEKHPEVLQRYKESLSSKPRSLVDEQIEKRQPEPRKIDFLNLVRILESIPTGNNAASKYHQFIIGALESIFYPGLRKPVKEEKLHGGRKRVDIVFNNGADRGFFFDLVTRHKVHCPYVFFECKNYSHDPENPELDQLTGRFSDKRGNFGMLVCRTVGDKAKMRQKCKDALYDNRGYILVLDDSDIDHLLELREEQDFEGINNYIDDLFRQLVM